MIRVQIIFFLLVGTSIGLFGQSKPDIIVYLSDDMSAADAGIYGAKVVKTPTIDKLGNEGMVFNNAFIASPACGPSRAALLTGLMPARNGAEANHTYPGKHIPMLTDKLLDMGYRIFAFGKVSHSRMDKQCDVNFYSHPRRNLYSNVKSLFDTLNHNGPTCIMIGDRRPHVLWTEEAIYNAETVDLPEYFINTKETRKHRARYYTDVSGMDKEMGKIYEYLQKNINKNHIFLHSSDHGSQWPFGKWNLYDAGIKVPLIVKWEGKIPAGQRTNAMVSWIDILPTLIELAGGNTPDSIDGKSFAKVLLENKPEHREYIFTTHSGDGNKNIYPIRSIRSKKYKLIWNIHPDYYHTNHSDILRKDGAGAYWDSWEKVAKTNKKAAEIIKKYHIRPKEEFYDLEADPTEQINIINNPTLQPEISKMRTLLKKWIEEQGDQLTVFNKPYPINKPLPVNKNSKQ